MKKYIIISGFNIHDNNRGTGALGYGAISFLKEKGFLKEGQQLLNICYANKFWKYRNHSEIIHIQNCTIQRSIIYVSTIERFFFEKLGISFPWSTFAKAIKQIALVANINGGDGFSDIYGDRIFKSRLWDAFLAIKRNIPYIFLPQTIGPFEKKTNIRLAKRFLIGAQAIYVRDDKYVDELKELNVSFEVSKDLSAYMMPQVCKMQIAPNAIGINISGLAYDNNFPGLCGQFDYYPKLIKLIIEKFQKMGKEIYLIPHSYNYTNPEPNNDDLKASLLLYKELLDKNNVHIVNHDLTPPEVKYVISKMSFFIGTRMHANFAAIFTSVPLYGLAYSYKFEGAFKINNVFDDNISMINNIAEKDCPLIAEKIICFYKRKIKK